MSTNRIVRIVIGLAFIGYAVYSDNAWFSLGVLPLITGIINWCPLEMKMGTCDPSSGCCASNSKDTSESACCSPKTDTTAVAATNVKSFKAAQPSKTLQLLLRYSVLDVVNV